jgi:hypothetical protein
MARPKRPFWMHQLVEYILGGMLVASGLQSHTPIVPSVLGGAILLNAAVTKGALSAFRGYGRRMHSIIDPVIIMAAFIMVVQPWISIANPTRLVIIAVAMVHLVVYLGSSFVERQKAPKAPPVASSGPADRSTEIGRTAGRVVGSGVNTVRKWLPKSDD